MARRKKETIQIPTKRCLHCGMELEYKNFYQLHNSSNIYSGNDNYIPICKDCLKILYEQFKIQYANQFSVLGMKSEELKENAIEKLVIRRLCMAFDIYYSDRLFDAALKQIEKFPTLDMVSAYMKVSNLKQNKRKTYGDTIAEENLSQELLKSAMVDKVRKQFEDKTDNELYQDVYNLCIKLLQSLRRNCNVVDIEKNDYGLMLELQEEFAYE
ncbi:MAG: hypothetical protein HDT39_09235 [Lachnospiraceae bacterium]|nr:hypothetical protein [Lachnospiraceae bacterium]